MSDRRRSSWSFRPMSVALAVGVVLYLLIFGSHLVSAAIGALVFMLLIYFGPVAAGLADDYTGQRRIKRLRDHRLAIQEDELHQVGPNGFHATINLDEPFTHHYLYRSDGEAVYRIRQGRIRLDFPSSDPLAAEIVQDVLGLHWPPSAIRAALG